MITTPNTSNHFSTRNHNQSDFDKIAVSQISEIYKEDVNISIWKRKLNESLILSSEYVIKKNPKLEFSEVIQPKDVKELLKSLVGTDSHMLPLFDDVSYLAFMFCELFDQKKLWLRLDGIDHPMCPRFHTDKIKCRLVTTYVGPATQWLPQDSVDRSKLGYGNDGKPDDESGLFSSVDDIKQLETGHVALLKGESWQGNEGAGIVHRSPHSDSNYRRLYLTIDFVESFINIFGSSMKI